MSTAGQSAAEPYERLGHSRFPGFLPAFISVAVLYGLAYLQSAGSTGIVNSDDVMRLVTVRDLLQGQSWFDPNQYRLGLDGGTLMHWSRLVDAPLYLVYTISYFVSGNQAAAEQAMLYLWPAITLTLALLAIAHVSHRLKMPQMAVPAIIIGAVCFYSIGVFGPGAIDHHNIQVALGMWLLALLIPTGNDVVSYAWAGAIVVLMLAIGMETLPYVAVAGIWVALAFLVGAIGTIAAAAFGLSVATITSVVFVGTISPANYSAIYCDAYSLFHLGVGVVAGAGLFASSFFGKTFMTRLIGLFLTGLATLTLMLTAFGECLANPLASLDPKLRTFWLEGVVETRSALDLWQSDPFQLFGIFGLATVGLVVAIGLLFSNQKHIRNAATLWCAIIACALLVTVWQQRGNLFAASFAILPLAVVVTQLRERYQQTNHLTDFAKMAGMGILSLNMFWWIVGANAAQFFGSGPTLQQQAASVSARDYCYEDDVYDRLAAEPKGVILGATDIGAMALKNTEHRVLAGPYHRNTEGNLLMIEAMLAQPNEARKLVDKGGVTLIADCVKSVDAADFKEAAPNGLQALLHKGEIPQWLQRIEETANQPLVIYRVIK